VARRNILSVRVTRSSDTCSGKVKFPNANGVVDFGLLAAHSPGTTFTLLSLHYDIVRSLILSHVHSFGEAAMQDVILLLYSYRERGGVVAFNEAFYMWRIEM
jgi:hypothetical protein